MEIKDRILLAAQEQFLRNGIKSVSMDDIAAHLGMSKKTLYKWFENKDQIVHATMERHLGTTQQECDCLQADATTAVDELFKMMGWLRNQFAGVHNSIFFDLKKYHPATWQLWMAHKNQYILQQIEDNLRRGMSEGLYRADLQVDIMARMRLAQIELAFDTDVFPARQFDAQRVQLAMLEHFMLGVATLKGHKLINQYRHVTEEE